MNKYLLFILLLLVGAVGLLPVSARDADVPWPTGGWQTAIPESQGIDSALLAQAYEAIQQSPLDFRSLLVIRHGYLVAESYRYPYTAETLHDQRSITKSNTATMVGIAIADGAISGIDAPMASFFPDQEIAHMDSRKQAITLENLLTMTSGLAWNESQIGEMAFSSDWTGWMLNRPVADEPGTRFNYCSGCSNLLAAIVENATGKPLADYAGEKLYGPLGITHFQWDREPYANHHTLGGFGLFMTPRDMAKLGYLYLHHGEWDGAQVVPADWVKAATSPQAPVTPADDFNYGYQWWLPATDESHAYYFAAQGYGGQTIFVRPDLDLVVVVTAGGVDFGKDTLPILESYVIPAAASDAPLPENPLAQARLQAAIAALKQPQAVPVAELPQTAASVSGKFYDFSFAPFYSGWKEFAWNQMALTFEPGASEAMLNFTLVDGQIIDLPLGLDGVPRITDLPGFGTLGLDGGWESADTFQFTLQVLGLPETYSMRARFSEGQMNLTFTERITGDTHMLAGKLAA